MEEEAAIINDTTTVKVIFGVTYVRYKPQVYPCCVAVNHNGRTIREGSWFRYTGVEIYHILACVMMAVLLVRGSSLNNLNHDYCCDGRLYETAEPVGANRRVPRCGVVETGRESIAWAKSCPGRDDHHG